MTTGQRIDGVRVADRVRITAPWTGLTRATGFVREVVADSLVGTFDSPVRAESVARSAISEMETSTG